MLALGPFDRRMDCHSLSLLATGAEVASASSGRWIHVEELGDGAEVSALEGVRMTIVALPLVEAKNDIRFSKSESGTDLMIRSTGSRSNCRDK